MPSTHPRAGELLLGQTLQGPWLGWNQSYCSEYALDYPWAWTCCPSGRAALQRINEPGMVWQVTRWGHFTGWLREACCSLEPLIHTWGLVTTFHSLLSSPSARAGTRHQWPSGIKPRKASQLRGTFKSFQGAYCVLGFDIWAGPCLRTVRSSLNPAGPLTSLLIT